jgi:hypothetical protein
VGLTPVSDYDDRAEAFNDFVSLFNANGLDYFSLMYPTPTGKEVIPETMQVLREEFRDLMATAPKPPGPGRKR